VPRVRGHLTSLDPKDPLVLDVRTLQRRPGSMVTVERSAPAPAGLGVAMARVPEGSPIELDLRLESVLEGVLVSGTADLQISAECSRCLEPFDWHEEVDLTELFRYPATDARGVIVEEEDESEDPLPVLDDDLIDLQPVLRDAVVLDLPLAPLCSEECLGLCPQCGVRLADDPQHAHETTDPRWAALAALTEPDAQ
jgi:uncharacterized protein